VVGPGKARHDRPEDEAPEDEAPEEAEAPMITKGLLVRLDVRRGMEDDAERFLGSLVPLVADEPGTIAWFAVRLGRGEYGLLVVFPDEAARDAHLQGRVAEELTGPSDELFETVPVMRAFDVLASKLPDGPGSAAAISTGLLLSLNPKEGKERDAAELLRGARSIVAEEPGTAAWFAIGFDDGRFAIFDVFPDSAARFAHLTGGVPRELVKRGAELFAGFPDMQMLDVVATSFARPPTIRTTV
jgi:quinol monooxygenase YgiN